MTMFHKLDIIVWLYKKRFNPILWELFYIAYQLTTEFNERNDNFSLELDYKIELSFYSVPSFYIVHRITYFLLTCMWRLINLRMVKIWF